MGAIGILGGTFDPVHCGHTRLAVEMRERLELDVVRLMPAGDPQLRGAPGASAQDRLAMLEAALDGADGLEADGRETERAGPTYTVRTMEALRRESGDTPLCLIVGMDAFARLEEWHRWSDLFGLCHLAVAHRPGARMPASAVLNEVLEARRCDEPARLARTPCGYIALVTMPLLDISATQVRASIAAKRNIRWLVPPEVDKFIHRHGLYCAPSHQPS